MKNQFLIVGDNKFQYALLETEADVQLFLVMYTENDWPDVKPANYFEIYEVKSFSRISV